MMTNSRIYFFSLLFPALSLTACASATGLELEDEEEDLATVQQAESTSNSLTSNSLTSNSLTSNSLTSNSLTSNSLTSNSLTSNSLISGALINDGPSRDVLRYIVSCALPKGAQIDINLGGTPYTFYGDIGLAPYWGNNGGFCDANCRHWISACVLSRVNYLGLPVAISIRGSLPVLAASPAEKLSYPNPEATYYGNIFVSPQVRYACKAPGSTLISRVCGPTTTGCVMDVLGDCPNFCRSVRADGSYPNCDNENGSQFPGTITVFRQ